MLDLSALDNEFSGMTRSDILRALLEAAGDGIGEHLESMRNMHAPFSADEDSRGRLVAAFDADGDGDNDAPRPMPLDNLYYGFVGLPRRHALGLMHDAAERSHHDNLTHQHAVDFADDNRGRLAEFYSPDQLRASDGKWTAGAGDEAAREHSLRSIREFAAKPDAPSREELEQLGGHLSRLTVKQLRQVRDEHGLRGSGPDKEQFVAKLGEKFVAHRAGNAMSPAERREYDASKKAVAAIKQHGAESPEAKAAGEEHRAAWEGLRREEGGEAAKPMVMPAAAQITQEKKEIASTPIDDRGRIVDNKPVETKPQPQEKKMDATATKDCLREVKVPITSRTESDDRGDERGVIVSRRNTTPSYRDGQHLPEGVIVGQGVKRGKNMIYQVRGRTEPEELNYKADAKAKTLQGPGANHIPNEEKDRVGAEIDSLRHEAKAAALREKGASAAEVAAHESTRPVSLNLEVAPGVKAVSRQGDKVIVRVEGYVGTPYTVEQIKRAAMSSSETEKFGPSGITKGMAQKILAGIGE